MSKDRGVRNVVELLQLRSENATLRDQLTDVRERTTRAIVVFKALVERLRKAPGMNGREWDDIGQDVLRSIAALEILTAPKAARPKPKEQAGTCNLCHRPMPPGEEMFKFHGYSGDCPEPSAEDRECHFCGHEAQSHQRRGCLIINCPCAQYALPEPEEKK